MMPTGGALEGLRVLDLSRVLAGPWASQILGDLGAEVIKVEQPSRGDETRHWGPPFATSDDGPTDAAYYFCANRNKRSVAIDFAQPEGAELLRRLAAQSDIVIENFRPGGLSKYGLDYVSLSATNASLIYCSITGFGQTGPYAKRGGYDFLIQGLSGLMSVTGNPDGSSGAGPMKVGIPVSDLFTGLYAAVAILAAARHRERTGEGQYIDCALLDSQVAILANQGMNHLIGGVRPRRLGNAHPNVVPYRDFATSDGHILVACGADHHFQRLCLLLSRADLANDPRLASNGGRQEHRDFLDAELQRSIATWRSADLLDCMEVADIPSGPINHIDEALADPQIEARRLLHTMQRDDGTAVKVIGFPAQMSGTPASYREAPPRHGQDTASVLSELLGTAPEALDILQQNGIVRLDGTDHG